VIEQPKGSWLMHSLKILLMVLALSVFVLSCNESDDASQNADGDKSGPAFGCETSADCETGEICVDMQCRQWCSDELECSEGWCDLENHACIPGEKPEVDGDSEDGDTDEDTASDGDRETQIDGDDDEQTDGDIEGEDLCDGKECPPLQHCDPESGDCVYDDNHCMVSGCDDDAYLCDEDTGECIIEPGLAWPGYCQPCFTAEDCPGDGAVCGWETETQESFCGPICRETDPLCPQGAVCKDVSDYTGSSDAYYVCSPDPHTCGNAHNTGGSCATDDECAESLSCIKENDNEFGFRWPRGHCTATCEDDSNCAGDTRCSGIQIGPDDWERICLLRCNPMGSSCRENYKCQPVADSAVCVPETMGGP